MTISTWTERDESNAEPDPGDQDHQDDRKLQCGEVGELSHGAPAAAAATPRAEMIPAGR